MPVWVLESVQLSARLLVRVLVLVEVHTPELASKEPQGVVAH